VISLIDLHKYFQSQKVLDGLNLEIPDGRITILLGRSGSGKSVTLKHIIGLIRPDSGKVIVDDQDIATMDTPTLNQFRRRFGMLFQDGALFDSMTVGENIAFPLIEHTRLSKKEIVSKVAETLEMVGLSNIEQKIPSELSGGMRKRVGLARAIVLQPKILLFDEPTTGLDPLMIDNINRLIVDTQKQLNVTAFIISHDVEATLEIAHKVAVLHKGKIVEAGPPDQIRQSQHPFVRAFLDRKEGEFVEL